MIFETRGYYDIVTAGEVILDMISNNYADKLDEVDTFNRHLGGSPANIACNIARQGLKVAMITSVGKDGFGRYIINKLNNYKVNTEYVFIDDKNPTSLVFVTKSKGTPDFSPYRCADKQIFIGERELQLIDKTKIFHVSSFALSQNPARDNLLKAIKYARSIGKIVCIDPNYREILWTEDREHSKEFMFEALSYADIIKPSEDDAFHLLGEMSVENYCRKFISMGVKLVLMTLGSQGAVAYDGLNFIYQKTMAVSVVDTTGAGDAFWSGFYIGVLNGYDHEKSMKVGSIFAAFKLKSVGAIAAIPMFKDILKKYEL